MTIPQMPDLVPDDPNGVRFFRSQLIDEDNKIRQKMNILSKAGVSMEAYIDGPLTGTKYQDFLVNKLRLISQEGGGVIKLPQGFENFSGQPGFGTDSFYGTTISQTFYQYSNVLLDGGMAYRRNALVADPALPRSTPLIKAAVPAADWRPEFAGSETKSIEANFGLIGCCIHGREQSRPAVNTSDILSSHGYLVDLDGSISNGPQSTINRLNDTRGKLLYNVFMEAPESGLNVGGRGEYQMHGNHVAGARVFGVYLNTFDNHTGFNVISNCGHSGLLIRNGNNRFGWWKIWFIGFLPTDNRWGTRDQLYNAMAATNATGEILDQSYCVDINGGPENVDGFWHFQDTYGHGLRDQGKTNRHYVFGDMVGGMRGGDFGQTVWTTDSAVRSDLIVMGNNMRGEVVSRKRDPTKFVGGGGTCDAYPILMKKSNDDGFDINVSYDRVGDGYTDSVAFASNTAQVNRAQGRLVVNGRKVWDRTYTKPSDRLTTGTANTLNLDRGITEIDISSTATGNVGGSIANARAENFRHEIKVRRTPGTTYKAVVTGTFLGGTTLTIDADYASVTLEFVFNPGETVGAATGRWIIVGGSSAAVVIS